MTDQRSEGRSSDGTARRIPPRLAMVLGGLLLLAVLTALVVAGGLNAEPSVADGQQAHSHGVDRHASTGSAQPDISMPTTSDSSATDESTDGRQNKGLLFATVVISSLLGLVVLVRRYAPNTLARLTQSFRSGETGKESDDTTCSGDSGDTPLADKDVVKHLLREHDGRLPQSKVVADTDWSKAKVSRLLCEMEEEGDVVKIQLGRQNLVCLDGCEPELSKPMPPPPDDARSSTRPPRRRGEE